jgi:hypothetical protein
MVQLVQLRGCRGKKVVSCGFDARVRASILAIGGRVGSTALDNGARHIPDLINDHSIYSGL